MDYEKLLLALIDKMPKPYTNRDKIIQAFRIMHLLKMYAGNLLLQNLNSLQNQKLRQLAIKQPKKEWFLLKARLKKSLCIEINYQNNFPV
jgi:hypothetical protein